MAANLGNHHRPSLAMGLPVRAAWPAKRLSTQPTDFFLCLLYHVPDSEGTNGRAKSSHQVLLAMIGWTKASQAKYALHPLTHKLLHNTYIRGITEYEVTYQWRLQSPWQCMHVAQYVMCSIWSSQGHCSQVPLLSFIGLSGQAVMAESSSKWFSSGKCVC